MNEIILLMIVMAATAYVVQPYWRKETVAQSNSNARLADLIERRNSLLAQIKEIEFDHEVGKISAADFAEINARYRSEAIAVLRRIDELKGNKLSRRKKGTMFCSQCGSLVKSKDRFCAICGNRLKK